MSSQLPIPPPGFDQLSIDEQLEYVEELLTYISSRKDYVEIPEWHRKIIEERMARYHSGENDGTTWEEFEKELIEEFGKELIKG